MENKLIEMDKLQRTDHDTLIRLEGKVDALGVVSNTTTFPIGKTVGSIAGGTYAGFTTSGAKGVNCCFVYQY